MTLMNKGISAIKEYLIDKEIVFMLNDDNYYREAVSKINVNNTWNPIDLDDINDKEWDNITVPDV